MEVKKKRGPRGNENAECDVSEDGEGDTCSTNNASLLFCTLIGETGSQYIFRCMTKPKDTKLRSFHPFPRLPVSPQTSSTQTEICSLGPTRDPEQSVKTGGSWAWQCKSLTPLCGTSSQWVSFYAVAGGRMFSGCASIRQVDSRDTMSQNRLQGISSKLGKNIHQWWTTYNLKIRGHCDLLYSHSCERDVSVTTWAHFFIFGTKIHERLN